jgi:hypothetical protein
MRDVGFRAINVQARLKSHTRHRQSAILPCVVAASAVGIVQDHTHDASSPF